MRRSEEPDGAMARLNEPSKLEARFKENRIRLSELAMPDDARMTTVRATATPLAGAQVRELISQLPDLSPIGTCPEPLPDQPDKPPALDGVVQQAVFPSRQVEGTTGQTPGPSGPLRVLSWSPEGQTDATSQITVRFSHPMISLSEADRPRFDPPVRMTPQPRGQWQWLDPQTLCFVPDNPLPMATEFCVEVAEGVAAADGSVLREAHHWSFQTTPPRMVRRCPEDPLQDTLPILFLGFDQQIDADEMLAYLALTAEDNAPARRPLRLATEQETSNRKALQACISVAPCGTWLAVRPVEPLPDSRRFTVRLLPGAPSREGPLRTPGEQVFDFQTCGPFAVVEHRVGWEEHSGPEAPWQIRFSNPLDPRSIDRSDIHVEPAMPELDLALWEQTLVVYGWRQANTSYRLTLPAGLRDVFGQRLNMPSPLSFQVGRAESGVFVQGRHSHAGDTILLRPAHGTRLPVFTVNHRALSIRIHAVQVEDWPAYSDPALWRSYSSYRGYEEHRKSALDMLDWLAAHLPGKCVANDVVEIDGHDNELVETRIDLQPALQGVVGHAIVVIQALDRPERDPLVSWCQVTRIGLHAFADREGVLVWTTDLQTGAPLVDVSLRLEGPEIEGKSGPDGRAWLPRSDQVPRMLVARRDNDVAILPDHYQYWPERQRWQKIVWCVMDGRGIYRPGEEIRIKAWPRLRRHGQHGQVHLLDRPYQAVCELVSRQETWIEQRVDVDPRFGMEVRFTLPAELPSGQAAIQLVIPEFDDYHHYHVFQVEEYREPEFEVSHQRAEVRFAARVDQAGTARLQVAAFAPPWSDAVAVDFPVRMPVTTESFAHYGHLDEGTHRVPLILPSDTWPDGGRLEITLSSTGVSALTDAVRQLLEYPFDCAEQLASRILGLSGLTDVPAILTGVVNAEEIRCRIERDVARLRSLQNADGGFPFWRRGEPSWPLPSIHAAHALFLSHDWEDGSKESVRCLAESLEYLTKLHERFPERHPREVRWYLGAYALYVRSLWDTAAWKGVLEFLEDADLSRLPVEAAGWLLQVLCSGMDEHGKQPDVQRQIDRMMAHLNNRARQSAATAYFTHPGEATAHSRWLLLTEFRGDAVALDALLTARPDHPLVSKLVRGLLQRRRHGHWGTTLDNVFVLRALLRYFAAHEPADPNFEAGVWLAGRCVGQCRLDGSNAPPCRITIPIRELAAGQTELLLHKQGRGRMHYRLALELARQATDIGALDRGFRLSRVYEPIEAASDIRRDKDGTWYIRAGALVRVRLLLATALHRYHVALVDPLPGGLEPLNPALAVTTTPDGPALVGESERRSTFPWFEHQNLRDDRAEAFASVIRAGVYEYSYLARATTLGQFAAPPTKVEEMYHPETFGRGPSDRVVVEELVDIPRRSKP